MMKKLLFLISIVIVSSCTDEELLESSWEEEKFSPITSNQPFQDVKPAYDFDYWELIWHSGEEEKVHFRHGSICKDANDPMKCAFKFYRMDETGAGFSGNMTHRDDYYYLKSNEQGYNKVWDEMDELKIFLGMIDSEGDALLLASASGYYFQKDDQFLSGIKKRKNGYELIALKTISNCDPFQVNRVLLRIDKNGNITKSGERVYINEAKECNL